MNKLGLVAGFLLIPFLLLMFVPWGQSTLPLYLFDSGTNYIGIWGISPPGATNGVNINFWWFSTTELNRILGGIVFWFFTLFASFFCIAGAKQPVERGKKLYLAAFFLLLIPVIMLFIDGLGLGSLFLEEIFSLTDLFSGLRPGFFVYLGTSVLVLLAAITYKEA